MKWVLEKTKLMFIQAQELQVLYGEAFPDNAFAKLAVVRKNADRVEKSNSISKVCP